MQTRQIQFTLHIAADAHALPDIEKGLLQAAKTAIKDAYAPYSKFRVGAAILLANGKIVTGTNQENASYPVGLCAEGTALSVASSVYPDAAPLKIAVTAVSERHAIQTPIAPCGICRQKLLEYEQRFNRDIEIIMAGETGEVHIVKSVKDILPMYFSGKVL
jgi:cytidine deaminase